MSGPSVEGLDLELDLLRAPDAVRLAMKNTYLLTQVYRRFHGHLPGPSESTAALHRELQKAGATEADLAWLIEAGYADEGDLAEWKELRMAQQALPTEPGNYVDVAGDPWQLDSEGKWWTIGASVAIDPAHVAQWGPLSPLVAADTEPRPVAAEYVGIRTDCE